MIFSVVITAVYFVYCLVSSARIQALWRQDLSLIQPCWHLLKRESFMGLPWYGVAKKRKKKKRKFKPAFELRRFSAHDLVIPMG